MTQLLTALVAVVLSVFFGLNRNNAVRNLGGSEAREEQLELELDAVQKDRARRGRPVRTDAEYVKRLRRAADRLRRLRNRET